jgi:hypothetical protein
LTSVEKKERKKEDRRKIHTNKIQEKEKKIFRCDKEKAQTQKIKIRRKVRMKLGNKLQLKVKLR